MSDHISDRHRQSASELLQIDAETADRICGLIAFQASAIGRQYARMKMDGDGEDRRRKLKVIRGAARQLADKLRQNKGLIKHDIARFFNREDFPEYSYENGLQLNGRKYDSYISLTERISNSAQEAMKKSRRHATPQREIWAFVFELWISHGQQLKLSEGGPLAKFVGLAHELAGWDEPNYETLRSALKAHRRRVTDR